MSTRSESLFLGSLRACDERLSVMMIVGCGALRQDRTNAGLLAGGRRPAARGTMRTMSQRSFDLCVSAVARLFGSQTAKAQDAAITNVRIIVGSGR